MWASQAAVALAVAFFIAVIVGRVFRVGPDPREPLVLNPRIPVVGHIIGLLSDGAEYFAKVSKRCSAPIFSLPMFPSRTYVVTSPVLAGQIQRASASLLFNPLILEVTNRMVGFDTFDPATMPKIRDLKAKQEGRRQFMEYMHDMLYSVLSPSEIKLASSTVLGKLTERLGEMPESLETGLFQWVRTQFTWATAYTFYGPENPFVMDPSLIDDFWEFESGMIRLMVGFLPMLTARKAYVGRERVYEALYDYFDKGRWKKASKLIHERFRIHDGYGLNPAEKARSEVGMLFGALVNGGVSCFWVLNNIFSRPELLSEIRVEISKNALDVSSDAKMCTISFERLKSSCPLLNSTYRETLRLTSPMSSSRLVTEDTIVADTYLLRKNSVVQIAGGVLHEDPEIWGPDAGSFNSRRFISSPYGTKTGSSTASDSKNVHPAAFRAFGGGSVFCPGRHFAQVEILGLVAAAVMGWDLLPPEGKKSVQWDPPMDRKRIPIGVMKPLREVNVCMRRRDGLKDFNIVLSSA